MCTLATRYKKEIPPICPSMTRRGESALTPPYLLLDSLQTEHGKLD